MRHVALLALVLPSAAFAQGAPSEASPQADEPKADEPKRDEPKRDEPKRDEPKRERVKGRIIDPWGRIPRPRDGMRLPDPRAAAEKASAAGSVSPASAEPATSTEPVSEPRVTVEPAAAAAPAPAPRLRAPSTPFRTTKIAIVRPPPASPREGLTLEAGTGIGWIHIADDVGSVTSPGGVAGVSIGIGGWLDDGIALTARLAGSSVPSEQGLVVAAFLGPSFQIWVGERTWLGLGIGLGVFGIDADQSEYDYSLGGVAGDLRLGHTFYASGKHALNASLELTPGRVSEESVYGTELELTVMSIGLLLGWQYL